MQANNAIIIIGIILCLIGFVAMILTAFMTAKKNAYYEDHPESGRPKHKMPKWPSIVIIAGIVAMLGGNSFTVVPTGYTGVKTTFGIIDQKSCMSGFNALTPFVQKISLVNNKQQDKTFTERINGETDTKTAVYAENIVVTHQIEPEASAWIYANVDNWVEDLVDQQITGSALRSAMVICQDENVTNRDHIEPLAKQKLQEAIDEKYGPGRVTIKQVIIVNMDFEQSYNDAIARRAAATQEQQEQAIRNQIKIDMATAEADAERARAQGAADAELILANGKAQANQKLSESITELTQRQDAIEKWDGTLPMATSNDVSFGILNTAGNNRASNVPDVLKSDASTPEITVPPTYTPTNGVAE